MSAPKRMCPHRSGSACVAVTTADTVAASDSAETKRTDFVGSDAPGMDRWSTAQTVCRLPPLAARAGRDCNVLTRRTSADACSESWPAKAWSAVQFLPGSIVRVRQERWRVVSVHQYDACAVVTLHGISPPRRGVEQRFITPFDRFESVARCARPRRASTSRWQRACRAAMAAAVPPGGLHAPIDARLDL